MPDGSVNLAVERIEGVICVAFDDLEIPIASVESVQRQILQHLRGVPMPKVILDFTSVQYIPTPALGAVVSVHSTAVKRGGHMAVVGLNDALSELFRISKLNKIIDIQPDVDTAMRAMGV